MKTYKVTGTFGKMTIQADKMSCDKDGVRFYNAGNDKMPDMVGFINLAHIYTVVEENSLDE